MFRNFDWPYSPDTLDQCNSNSVLFHPLSFAATFVAVGVLQFTKIGADKLGF
jgi:hypothetical protein